VEQLLIALALQIVSCAAEMKALEAEQAEILRCDDDDDVQESMETQFHAIKTSISALTADMHMQRVRLRPQRPACCATVTRDPGGPGLCNLMPVLSAQAELFATKLAEAHAAALDAFASKQADVTVSRGNLRIHKEPETANKYVRARRRHVERRHPWQAPCRSRTQLPQSATRGTSTRRSSFWKRESAALM
jgi:hypothetical protein